MSLTRGMAKALFLLALGASGAVQACSCIQVDAAQIFRESDLIVIARVKNVRYQPAGIGESRVVGDIEVLETLKSTTGAPITRIWTEPEIPACGLPLQAGRVYLMTPGGADGEQVTHCRSWALGSGNKEKEATTKALIARRDERERRRALRDRETKAQAVSSQGSAPSR